MSALRALLRDTIDYAGLFPPAGLVMPEAVANYAGYRDGEHAWALGRFVVPAGRLAEFDAAAGQWLPRTPEATGWRLSVLIGPEAEADLGTLEEFNRRHGSAAAGVVAGDVVEGKAESADAVARLLERVPPELQAYVEIPVDGDPAALVAAIGRAGGRAKVRTGGITASAFPEAADLVRFIRTCLSAAVPFKATAGLHHPLRAEHRLTYEPGGASGTMFGFLNVFAATAFMAEGLDDGDAERLLEERDRDAFRFDPSGMAWRGRRLDLSAIARARETGIVSFGSCSFTEPLEDLAALDLL
jgi:hypothetical protein